MEQKEIDVILLNQEARLKFYLQCNEAMIDYSKMAARGALLLNGAAIIPILYSKVTYLYPCAIFFGIGAGFAVASSCMSYLTQWLITTSAYRSLIQYPFRTSNLAPAEDKEVLAGKKYFRWIKPFRIGGMGCVGASLAFFGYALWLAWRDLHQLGY